MDTHEHKASWIERVEDLVNILEGSSIGELELTEAGTKIIIRRQPGMMMVSSLAHSASMGQPGVQVTPVALAHATREDSDVAITAPLTGVYYSAPSPTSSTFVPVADLVPLGQVVA